VQAKAMQGFRKIEFKSFKAGIPRAYASAHIIMRCIWTSFDNVSTEECRKKSGDICVGGVVNCRLFQYPENPRKQHGWTCRKIQSISDTLTCIEYPDPTSSV